jgi:hypothetical protein
MSEFSARMCLKLRVQGNHSPAGVFEGQRPSRFWFSNAPARTQHRPKKFTFASIVAVPPILAGAFGGKGGSAPGHRADVKIGVPKLTSAGWVASAHRWVSAWIAASRNPSNDGGLGLAGLGHSLPWPPTTPPFGHPSKGGELPRPSGHPSRGVEFHHLPSPACGRGAGGEGVKNSPFSVPCPLSPVPCPLFPVSCFLSPDIR